MPEGKERKIALKTLPGIQGGKEGTPLPAQKSKLQRKKGHPRLIFSQVFTVHASHATLTNQKSSSIIMYAWVAVQFLHSPQSEDTQCVSLYPLPIIIKPTLRTFCVNIRQNTTLIETSGWPQILMTSFI